MGAKRFSLFIMLQPNDVDASLLSKNVIVCSKLYKLFYNESFQWANASSFVYRKTKTFHWFTLGAHFTSGFRERCSQFLQFWTKIYYFGSLLYTENSDDQFAKIETHSEVRIICHESNEFKNYNLIILLSLLLSLFHCFTFHYSTFVLFYAFNQRFI